MSGSSFARALAIVLRHEGGFIDDPDDPGGVTKHGISIRFAGSIHLDLDGDDKTGRADIIALGEAEAAKLYHRHFWRPCRCEALPPPVALGVFDSAVNQGGAVARKLLQQAARVAADGVIEPLTLASVRHANESRLIDNFMARRAERYARTRGRDRFGLGWYRRLIDVHRECVKMKG